MNFLLTNDDGITAPGLWAAERALSKLGPVLVVAPATNYSGYGAALPAARSLSYTPYPHDDQALPNVTAFALAATPATCAQLGLHGVFGGQPIDMVVSGVNAGANMGRDVLYSGTVGAAMTAQLLGVSALAVSLDNDSLDTACWDAAEWAIGEVFELWLRQHDSDPVVFNVNVPNVPVAALAGVQLTSFSQHSFLTNYRFEQQEGAPAGTLSVICKNNGRCAQLEMWTDAWAVARGYVSVTPMRTFPDLISIAPWAEPSAAIPITVFNPTLTCA